MARIYAVFSAVMLLIMSKSLLKSRVDLVLSLICLQWPVTLRGQARQHQQSLQPD